jgi:hypothetical protein
MTFLGVELLSCAASRAAVAPGIPSQPPADASMTLINDFVVGVVLKLFCEFK